MKEQQLPSNPEQFNHTHRIIPLQSTVSLVDKNQPLDSAFSDSCKQISFIHLNSI